MGETTVSITASTSGTASPRSMPRATIVSICDAVNAAHWQGTGSRPSASAPPLGRQHVQHHPQPDLGRHLVAVLLDPGLQVAGDAAGVGRVAVGTQALDGDVGQQVGQFAPAAVDRRRRDAGARGDQRHGQGRRARAAPSARWWPGARRPGRGRCVRRGGEWRLVVMSPCLTQRNCISERQGCTMHKRKDFALTGLESA